MTVHKNTQRLELILRTTPENGERALRMVAEEMVTDIKLSFGTSPSAPGEPPGVDTGTLKGGIMATPDGPGRILIHDQVEYGVYLEFGTERMDPRPWMTPVFEAWRGRIGRYLKDQGLL